MLKLDICLWFKCLWIFISAISFAFALLLTRELSKRPFLRKPAHLHACHRVAFSNPPLPRYFPFCTCESCLAGCGRFSTLFDNIRNYWRMLIIFLSLVRWCCRLSPGGMTVVVVNTSFYWLHYCHYFLCRHNWSEPVLSLVKKRCPFKSGGFVDSLFIVWTLFYKHFRERLWSDTPMLGAYVCGCICGCSSALVVVCLE